MSGANPYNDKDGRHSIALIKEKKVSSQHRSQEAVLLTPHDVVPQKPSARNTPMISFQPHHTEISTDRPSVSGRLYLHIPKIPGKSFRFVSLTLQLRLKESMAWTRQDLVSFEIEKQNWSQTVWERKITLPYQDRQVEESDEPYVAIVKEPSSKTHQSRIEIAADEWRWEWLMPVTEKEVRPESFEGSMGNVWYELEAKCLFRWDDVDKDGNAVPSTHRNYETSAESLAGQGSERGPAATLLKAVEVSSAKSKSLAQVFGKLRVGGKSKKLQATGDFSPADQHDQYIKESLRARKNSMPQGGSGVNGGHAGIGGALREGLLSASSRAHSSPHLSSLESDPHAHTAPEYPPFLIRKVLKLYFIKPPPNTSSSPAFFLPPPSMALPTLPGTRRLKAIIPGARIQVQIQIPSLIPIRGYAQTSQLVPDKKGGLVLSKHASQQQHHNYHRHNSSHHALEIDSGYLDNFQVALTVRKVTQKEINNNDHLKKRYHSASAGINLASVFATARDSHNHNDNGGSGLARKRLHSSNISNADLKGQYAAGARVDDGAGAVAGATVPAERPWRKEILVRKVKCEFWQKESCRFPTSSPDSPSRSIKYAMGPAFTYSEKEQVRERQRERSHSLSQQTNSQLSSAPRSPTQQTSAVSWDTSVTGGSSTPATGEDLRKSVRKNSSSALPMSPILKTTNLPSQPNLSAPPSPLQAPTMPQSFERKGSNASNASNASQYSSMISSQPRTSFSSSHASRPQMIQGQHSSQSSKPFMLLISVPLDSPKLRQTFAWPSAETPAPTTNKGYELLPMPMPRSIPDVSPMANTEASLVRDTDSPLGVSDSPGSSESGLADDDMVASSRRHQHHGQGRSHQHQSPADKANATRSRIEVKHYLSFRLSIDMLEYEGELDQDEDLDLEALEEQQLQQIRNRQELSAYRPNATGNNPKVLSRPGTALSTVAASGVSSSTSSVTASSSPLSPLPNSTNQGHEGSRQGIGVLSRATMTNATAFASSASSTLSSHASSVPTTTAAMTVTGGMMTIQPALTFLNSTAGLLDMESEVDNSHQGNRHQGQGGSHRRNSVSGDPALSGAADILAFPQPPFVNYNPQQRRGSNASQGTVKSISTTDSGHHHRPSHAASLVAGALGALKKKVSSSALGSIVNVVTPATPIPVPVLPQSLSANANTSLSPQQHHSQHHHHQQQRAHRTAPTVHKLKDFVIRVPITVVIQVEDLARVGTARIDGADSTTQTTGASATVTETLDGSHESDVETVLTAELKSEDGNRPVSSSSNNGLGKSSSFVLEGQELPYLALQEHQRLVEGKGGKGRKMSIGNSMEIRSIHGQIEGEDVDEDEDRDAEYLEGQFIVDQEQD
ncbi:hypothetical protein BG015_006140 [Linnemannia schmuckeri]|uniref:Uncharacterized protein n=1 Tax=Linnemannia schmuckeri TaxID=64567 RepID=A0A9P5S0G8_9FUNG|nr:hypothetical protein BG015_006140 [Linnemannia schmuckeri]